MSTPAPAIGDIINAIFNGIAWLINSLAQVFSENSYLIAQIIVLSALTVPMIALLTRVVRRIAGAFRGLF